MMYGIEDNEWKKIFALFKHFPRINKAILFGSRAKGNYKPFSDVDIALIGQDLSIHDLLHLNNEIDDLLLPYEFDICIYNNLKSEELKEHINRKGIVVYEKQDEPNEAIF